MRCTVILLIILIFLIWVGPPDYAKNKLENELYPLKKKVELIRLEKQKARLLKEIEAAEKEGFDLSK